MADKTFSDVQPIVIHVDPEIRDLIPDFLDNRRRDVAALADAVGARDFDAVYRLGHSLKGVGGGFGFDGISDIGRDIEGAALSKRLDDLEDRIQALRSYLDNLKLIYD
ncbi:MAG: Hpt domain-containing protein [Candidatus Binatia bacterium]